jgi:hypothetical protein
MFAITATAVEPPTAFGASSEVRTIPTAVEVAADAVRSRTTRRQTTIRILFRIPQLMGEPDRATLRVVAVRGRGRWTLRRADDPTVLASVMTDGREELAFSVDAPAAETDAAYIIIGPRGATVSGRSPDPARAPRLDVTISPVMFAVGDIASCPGGRQAETAAIVAGSPGLVALLGDLAYQDGSPSEFASCFDPTWGRFRDRAYPVPGNHEYQTAGASGYFGYFGERAGVGTEGWYAIRFGGWLLLALNSNCRFVGGCGAGSRQEEWLRGQLSQATGLCVLAYWHHPLFSSGQQARSTEMTMIWADLVAARADVVLAGHDHAYERLGPQDAAGTPTVNGVRSFVVGTGGGTLYPFGRVWPTSELGIADTPGVLRLRLADGSYDWSFVDTSRVARDAGSARCHAFK